MTPYFLPYQVEWLQDTSRIKIWEKSRRIGATYVQSFEDVDDILQGRVKKVWFTSADESAAVEYIDYCKQWTGIFGSIILKATNDDQALVEGEFKHTITLSNGGKIIAMSSNPKAFRSKGGKVVWDEAAWHDDPKKMWAALRPCITWGFPLRIISTHNGKGSLFNEFIEDIKSGKLRWSLHTTSIYTAVQQGLADKIVGKLLTPQEQEEWIEEERRNVNDEDVWEQEYNCTPVDATTAYLPYDLINSCESAVPIPIYKGTDEMALEGQYQNLYIGMDIGRKKDLSVIWGIERVGRTNHTRFVHIMQGERFSEQRRVLFHYLSLPPFRRACIDATGIGMQLGEEAEEKFGKSRVEAIQFSGAIKEEMAVKAKSMMEDMLLIIPKDEAVRKDFHAIKKITTASGHIRFDVSRNETDGHGDRFYACILANHAVAESRELVQPKSRRNPIMKMRDRLKGYM